MKNYTGKQMVLAFLLGVLVTIGGYRWYQIERSAYITDLRLSYIEGFLEQASRGAR